MRKHIGMALLLLLTACNQSNPPTESVDTPAKASEEQEARKTLEEVADNGGAERFIAAAFERAKANVQPTDIASINAALRPHDNIFKPEGEGPFPAVLFFHGCSGPTATHEQDWAKFYNDIGVAMIAVDSYAGRGIAWEDACDLQVMTPWQRAADVLATIAYARTLDYVDANRLLLTGFSHGAMTVWTTLVFASTETPPLGLATWPAGAMDGVRLSFPFYGACMGNWTVPIPTTMFLSEDDRYIDEQSCVDYATANPDMSAYFSYRIFAGATHTFDHARPNASNVEAGSVYDAGATGEAQATIAAAVAELNK
ncbi:MAG: dienelactone hydrolase family protein [Pseudomonadales bacterium]